MGDLSAEFDQVADEYEEQHARSIRISGESTDYFARQKVEVVASYFRNRRKSEPARILDFGAGIGNAAGGLLSAFPQARLTCLDVSRRSLEICRRRYGDRMATLPFDGRRIEAEDAQFDLIFTACVFHHIDHADHVRLLGEICRVMKPDGSVFLFEHNPWNPLTRMAVANCPFDENAVLIEAREMKRRFLAAGFARADVRFGVFFPKALSGLRRFERQLGWLPLGAQYHIRAAAY